MNEPDLMTAQEVADYLRCSIRHVAGLTAKGVLSVIHVGRSVRYRRKTLLATLERMEKKI